MREIASKGQLRWAYLRWAVVTVPFILLLGLASSRLAPAGAENAWYMALRKPDFQPPAIAFPIAWTLLYILMGLAVAMVINARGAPGRGLALGLFWTQLALNLAWSPVFFAAHRVSLALTIIGALIVVVAATIVLFWRVRRVAAVMLIPYLGWLCFASTLNYQILKLNPDAESLVSAPAEDQIQIR